MLPNWWDNSIATSPSGLQLAQMHFARIFNIDFLSLLTTEQPVAFLNAERKFKLSKSITVSSVQASAHFATAIAKIALQKNDSAQTIVAQDPDAFRTELLKTNACVSLQALLNWCAQGNIPVLHIESLPGKKMTGLVVREDNRFAIVLSKKATPSHQLFYLAHELGHIAKGHLKNDGFVADQTINGTDRGDADEKEADAYAIRLINGKEVTYSSSTAFKSGAQLFKAALSKAQQDRVDVGHIILNYAKTKSMFAMATVALRSIPGAQEGSTVINAAFFNAFEAKFFSDDQLELLHKATGFKTIA